MRMGEEDVVDLEDVVELQGGGDRPAIDGQLLLDEESGGAVSGKLAAVAPEDLDAHQSPSRRPGRAAEAQRTARGRTRSYGGEECRRDAPPVGRAVFVLRIAPFRRTGRSAELSLSLRTVPSSPETPGISASCQYREPPRPRAPAR